MLGYRLEDRFTAERGTVFLTGLQALARIPVEQLRVDRRAGHRTAAFVSGYPGSPLGGLDGVFAAAAKLSPDLPIVCRPALNEEYAATAVMGSQLAAAQPDRRYDGVVGIWYGKAPGVDRATDALRHAVYAGTSALGGAVALVGDDPTAKSSTVPSSSAGVLSDLHIPMLYPGDPAEALDLGRHAVALSRVSGLWTALKIVSDVADGTASVELDIDRVQPVVPRLPDGREYHRAPEGRLLTPRTLELEREIYEVRYQLASAYAAANRLNRVTVDSPDAWLGIIASGITYREVLEAFSRLGLDDEKAIAACGVRLLKMQMPLPFDAGTVRDFARGLVEVFVIEEKQPNIELLVKDALYSASVRPTVVGKHDESGRPLIPGYGGLDGDSIAPGLRARLETRVGHLLAPPQGPPARAPAATVDRSPFYCSGCPHNRSTEVPPGSLIGAGIGCHTMAILMDPARVGEIAGVTPMGNEGTQWIGMSDFIERPHFIQNLGDGTYFHSGQLAVTAAIAAGVNVTYKLLYNGAVAMTGGQHPQGQLPVAKVAANLLNQGVAKVLVTTDDVAKYDDVALPDSVEVWSRERLVEAQELLAKVPGVTVLIHDQGCAAEVRRARKRGKVETPSRRVLINERVCEGCGDCGRVSNCLSVEPVETAFGRKTRIDQTTCNYDYSCLEGDCPSFVTVDTKPSWTARLLGGRGGGRNGDGRELDELLGSPLPDPTPIVPVDDVAIRIAGIGGTGVVTVAQVLGTAAMLAGYAVRGLDQIGLSQKAGPVVSDLRFTYEHAISTNRLGAGQADLLLAFDQLVAASEKGTLPAAPNRTVVVGSSSPTPTGAMVTHPEVPMPSARELDERLAAVTRPNHRYWADAASLATRAFGDAVTANFLVTGMAVQVGALPIDPARIEEAIALNRVAVETNTRAFRLGRHVIANADRVERALDGRASGPDPILDASLRDRIEKLALPAGVAEPIRRFAADLVAYQDLAYATGYVDLVAEVAERERAIAPSSTALTLAVARNFHKLLAYKDEYEVARLLDDEDVRREARRIGGPAARVRYHLHPPMLRALGLGRKIAFGAWTTPLFRLLAKGKRLRGSIFDPFRWPEVRREERRLPGEYRESVRRLLSRLTAENLPATIEIAGLPDLVRGYEELKLERIRDYRHRLTEALRES